jgi:L-alanine-DL-glutamate epimerase-like enolase superfamily enzyme
MRVLDQLTEVLVATDGTVHVPRGPGIGFEINLDYITAETQTVERIVPLNGRK